MSAVDERSTKTPRGATILPDAVLDDENLDAGDLLVLMAIWRFDWGERGLGCTAAIETLMKIAKCNERTFRKHRRSLENRGYIVVHPRYDIGKRRGTDLIRIADDVRSGAYGGNPASIGRNHEGSNDTMGTFDGCSFDTIMGAEMTPSHGGSFDASMGAEMPPKADQEKQTHFSKQTHSKQVSANRESRASATPLPIASGTDDGNEGYEKETTGDGYVDSDFWRTKPDPAKAGADRIAAKAAAKKLEDDKRRERELERDKRFAELAQIL